MHFCDPWSSRNLSSPVDEHAHSLIQDAPFLHPELQYAHVPLTVSVHGGLLCQLLDGILVLIHASPEIC